MQIAKQSDHPELVEVLCRAFDSDPMFDWLIRSDAKRSSAFRQFFNMVLTRLARPHGMVHTNTSVNGAAVWYPPGRGKIGVLKQARLLPLFIRAVGWNKFPCRFAGIEKIEHYHLRDPHYYLQIIGVDPLNQGKGIGRDLLTPMMAKCDEEQTKAYLENTNETNIGYYERFGFEIVECIGMPGHGPKLWLMKRDPKPLERTMLLI